MDIVSYLSQAEGEMMISEPGDFASAYRNVLNVADIDEEGRVSHFCSILARGGPRATSPTSHPGRDGLSTDLTRGLVDAYTVDEHVARQSVRWALLAHWITSATAPDILNPHALSDTST